MFTQALLFVLALGDGVLSFPAQIPLQAQVIKPRKLHGRFLQISDMHPDPYYKVHTSPDSACHRKKPSKILNLAGRYGTSYTECDSPFELTNFTLDFLEEKWASEIDFVVWTGDNARHDNDRNLPRTPAEIYDLNRAIAKKMEKIFTKKGIPVVPSLGNNDVWPHNILKPGPNDITTEFASIWKTFIPFPDLQVFYRGAYYSVDVIPGQVAVISLNTMYFYDSNKAVGGCGFLDPNDPGNLQFDWLEVQLKTIRYRGMHVWISGHVPPSPGNYFPECYVRYVELALRFQDTILGHIFGHMNSDHVFFVEAIDLQLVEGPHNSTYMDLYDTLLVEFDALPKSAKATNMDDYAVINVAPPVVPNPYVPTFRVFSYNISGAGHDGDPTEQKKRKHGHHRGDHGNKAAKCKTEPYRNTWKCHLNESWYSDPHSPSRTNRLWTPLGYAQYYIPHLEAGDKTHEPSFELEYLTFPVERLHPDPLDGMMGDFQYPLPLHNLPRVLRQGNVSESKYSPYELPDLTIGSWVDLGRRLGDAKHEKLRRRFRKYMYFGGEEG
ncbi:endopolyphosphatase [Infundibulicybe gibba]|nr:endopolyphosphatase [Infundibulicybe gibba]